MEIIKKYFADLTPIQEKQFVQLEDLYKTWNEKINVISRKDIESLYTKHVLHSLTIASIVEFNEGQKVLDIGTGGGFPGIPLAILFPEVQFTLTDSIQKKINVVNEVVEALQLKNVTTLCTRVENIRLKNNFHFAISRAVAPLGDLWRWASPLIRVGNSANLDNGLICLKGGDLNQEISDSNTRPMIWKLQDSFNEEAFDDKYIIYVKR
jgi:16S rRNA (guanine527-N7)-methyltransferase